MARQLVVQPQSDLDIEAAAVWCQVSQQSLQIFSRDGSWVIGNLFQGALGDDVAVGFAAV